MQTPRILIVDDDMALLQALPHMVALRMRGVDVDTADTAYRALDYIQAVDYDVIVSDIKMPGMDGLELLAKIQELRPDIPTLLITGHADQSLTTQALRGGAYDFIQKPIDRVYFVAALHRAMQTRQLRRKVKEQQQALEQHAQYLEQLVERRTRELLAASEATEMLVRDMLDITLIEEHRLRLHCAPCNLVELCQQVLKAYTVGSGLELSFESKQETLVVEVDQDRISQALINLLFVARKHSLRGSPIAITLQYAQNEAIIQVNTTSENAGEETMPGIFARNYRYLDNAQQGNIPSDGSLALYLSQKIVEQHGGRVEVSNHTGNIYALILPVATEQADKLRDEQEEHDASLFQPPQWLIS